MPRFWYEAYDQKGARTAGEIQAETREAALQALFRQGHYPLALVDGGKASTTPWWQRELFWSRQLPRRHLVLLTRELATLVKAELPIDEVLRIIRLQPLVNARVHKVVDGVLQQVLDGASLSEAVASQKQAFPEFFWRIVQAGEAGGALSRALDELAAMLERSAEFRSRAVSALVYPALLLVMAGAALAVILLVLIPTIAPMFSEAGREPPATLQFLVEMHQTAAIHWPWLIVAASGLAWAVIAVGRNDRWLRARDDALLRIPLVGSLITNAQVAVLARTLGTMIGNGVPMLDALRVAGNALGNRAMADAVLSCAESMREGGNLVDSLRKSALFPELSIRLIGAGEQAAQLEAMLARLAEIYETALHRQLDRIVTLLTPTLTIVIGAIVGGLLLSVMGAIVSVNELALQ
jgi:general secretion pathway protein F